jgi:hypothetical protein
MAAVCEPERADMIGPGGSDEVDVHHSACPEWCGSGVACVLVRG